MIIASVFLPPQKPSLCPLLILSTVQRTISVYYRLEICPSTLSNLPKPKRQTQNAQRSPLYMLGIIPDVSPILTPGVISRCGSYSLDRHARSNLPPDYASWWTQLRNTFSLVVLNNKRFLLILLLEGRNCRSEGTFAAAFRYFSVGSED